MRNHFLVLFLSCCTFSLFAQISPIVTSFQVSRYQNSILIDWEIASGNLCTGLKVEHSIDSINFVSIYEYPGVCGNSSASERYSYTHSNPALKNYYRINLNSNAYSRILGINFIKIEDSGYALFPMPIESGSRLYFSNDNHLDAVFTIYNSSGKEVLKKETKESEIELGSLPLPIGVYHFNIVIPGRKNVEGKFVVAK